MIFNQIHEKGILAKLLEKGLKIFLKNECKKIGKVKIDIFASSLQIIKGTHKLGPINFLIHLSCQIKHFILSGLVALKCRSTFPKDYSFGSWRIPEVPFFSNFLSKKIKMDTETLNVKANTLVIANTHSFHRRSPNGRLSMPRESIHVQLRTPIF